MVANETNEGSSFGRSACVPFIFKGLYLTMIAVPFGISLLLPLVILAKKNSLNSQDRLALAFGSLIFSVLGVVFLCILLHKLWTAIQDGPARTTPGKAVGFMFIPFFNFYWIFQAYWGWAIDYNEYRRSADLETNPVSESTPLAICVLTFCSFIPFVGPFASFAALVLAIGFFNNAIDAINAFYVPRPKQTTIRNPKSRRNVNERDRFHYDESTEFISKGFYLSLIAGPLGISLVMSVVSLAMTSSRSRHDLQGAGIAFACGGLICSVLGVVFLCILLHKLWTAIQDGPARTTPGKAVGFLLIPFFNFYWIFQAYWGWAVDYNKYRQSARLDVNPVSEGLPLAMCILTICSFIPVIGLFASLANIVLGLIFFNSAINGVNDLFVVQLEGIDSEMNARPYDDSTPPMHDAY